MEVVGRGWSRPPHRAPVDVVNAAEILADDRLIEALRAGGPVGPDPIAAELAQWRSAVIRPRLAPTTPDHTHEAAHGRRWTQESASPLDAANPTERKLT